MRADPSFWLPRFPADHNVCLLKSESVVINSLFVMMALPEAAGERG